MKYFLDTEFIEGTQTKLFGKTKPTIDLISIGIVSEDGREYYAVSKEFNLKEAWNRYDLKYTTGQGDLNNLPPTKVYWIRDNVLKPIWYELKVREGRILNKPDDYPRLFDKSFSYKEFKRLIKKYGKTNVQIAKEVKHFVANRHIEANKEQWILDYDTKDVNFYGYYSDYDWVVFCWLFGKMIDLPKGFPMYCIDLKQDYDRIQKLYDKSFTAQPLSTFKSYPIQTNEHNALSDARWTYELYLFLNQFNIILK